MGLNDTLCPHKVNLKFIGSSDICRSLLTDSVGLIRFYLSIRA